MAPASIIPELAWIVSGELRESLKMLWGAPAPAPTPAPSDLSPVARDLLKVDGHLSTPADEVVQNLSLCRHAAEDGLFLRTTFHHISKAVNLVHLKRISSLTGILLKRAHCLRHDLHARSPDGVFLSVAVEDLICEEFFANLEHLLRCLQHIAQAAIAYLCFRWVVATALDAGSGFFRGEGWFTEWPGGRHPLSTTWPWNVRPALLVLWGVCWMFYFGDGPFSFRSSFGADPSGQDSRSGRISAPVPPPQSAAAAAAPAAPAAPPLAPGAHPQSGLSAEVSGALTTPTAQSTHTFSWPQTLSPQASAHLQLHAQAHTQTRRASGLHSHTPSAYLTIDAPYAPYITPSSSSYGSTDSLSASVSAVPWTYTDLANPPPAHLNDPASNIWQHRVSTNEFSSLFSTSPSALDIAKFQSNIDPSIPQYQQRHLIPRTQSRTTSRSGTALSWPHELSPAMQNYPSPHSDVSGSINVSTYPAHAGLMLSPKQMVASPSVAGSSESRPSSLKSLEPTRNVQGSLYCDFPECQRDPPVFTRPCEWTKHIEKHTRPYVCNEPGCETIRGFTYSGGLQRHKREVHGQYGGPKARCLCPHKDCNRSTGAGFSRRENLQEHLRRRHRNVSANARPDDGMGDEEEPSLQVGASRKRRRRHEEADVEAEVEGPGGDGADDALVPAQDLRQEVKKLRRELQERDERLRRLEALVERLTQGQNS